MDLTSPKMVTNLSARATPTGTGVTGLNPIGLGEKSRSFDSNVIGVATITAAATGNVATLTVSSGVIAQTTGSPVITDGDGKDFEGVTFPTVAKLHGIRIITGEDNAGTVILTGSSSGRLPAITLDADSEFALKLAAAGLTIAAQTIIFTFSNASDEVTIEFLGKSA